MADYVDDFEKQLKSKIYRIVWGSMIAWSTIAPIKAEAIYKHVEHIKAAMEKGSLIPKDKGGQTVAAVVAKRNMYRERARVAK